MPADAPGGPDSDPTGRELSEVFAPGLLAGQVAVVTGGGSGIGRAITLELVRGGAGVVVAGRRGGALDETVALAGPACSAQPTDIRDEADVERLLDTVQERHGRLDVLVNNAGGQYLAPAETITPNGFRAVIRLNLEATWCLTTAAAQRFLIPQRSGKIVNITLSPHQGMPGMAHSGAARAAVENLTRTLGTEWARFGLRVVSVALGTFATDALEKYPEPVLARASEVAPIQRLGRPDEAAWLVAFLASKAGDFFSGAVLTLDGGRDNWPGAWPPADLTDEAGEPLAEAREARA